MPEGQPQTGAEILAEIRVGLAFVLALVEVPVNSYGLVEEIRVSLHDSVGPQHLEKYEDDVGPVVVDVVAVDFFDGEGYHEYVEEHQADRYSR